VRLRIRRVVFGFSRREKERAMMRRVRRLIRGGEKGLR
jgi:hypothetical protein